MFQITDDKNKGLMNFLTDYSFVHEYIKENNYETCLVICAEQSYFIEKLTQSDDLSMRMVFVTYNPATREGLGKRKINTELSDLSLFSDVSEEMSFPLGLNSLTTEIDCAIIEGPYVPPGEILDFLCCAPFLKDDAAVFIRHRTVNVADLFEKGADKDSYACSSLLLEASFPDSKKELPTDSHPTVTLVKKNRLSKTRIQQMFRELMAFWCYPLSCEAVDNYVEHVSLIYDQSWADYLLSLVKYQNIAYENYYRFREKSSSVSNLYGEKRQEISLKEETYKTKLALQDEAHKREIARYKQIINSRDKDVAYYKKHVYSKDGDIAGYKKQVEAKENSIEFYREQLRLRNQEISEYRKRLKDLNEE